MPPGKEELSEREREILILVATGASNKEIAYKLAISANTVKVHLRNIFAKIGATSRTEAAMFAVNAGWVLTASEDLDVMKGTNGSEEPALPTVSIDPLNSAPSFSNRLIFWLALLMIALGLGAYLYWQAQISSLARQAENLAESRWRMLAPMTSPRSGMAVVVFDEHVYALAGQTRQKTVTGLCERYDPGTNQWIALADKPTPVRDVSAAVAGGKIYLPGGRTGDDRVIAALEIYDPRADSWSIGADLPVAVSGYALVSFEGKIYLFGGWDGEKYLDSVWAYDPLQDDWTEMSSLTGPRAYAGAVVSSGKIHLIGGYDGNQALALNEIYYPTLDDGQSSPWQSSTPLPAGRYRMGVASIADILYVFGGAGRGALVDFSLQLPPSFDRWQPVDSPVKQTWLDMGLAPWGTDLLLVGGELGGAPTDQQMSYQAIYTVALPIVR